MKPKTIGSITSAINRGFRRHDKLKKQGIITSFTWFECVKRHLQSYADSKKLKCRVWGPQGLCCRVTVQIGRRTRCFEVDNCDRGWHFGVRDLNVTLTEFRPGSIGELNGMNHPYKQLKQNDTLDKLFGFKSKPERMKTVKVTHES